MPKRQHHIRVKRGLGQEQILHDQVIEHRQRLACVVQIRIRHGRILTFDVHAVDRPGMDRIHDLDHGQTLLRIKFLAQSDSKKCRTSALSTD